jgi:predicted DNA-binding transcriptional regulator AlpA
LIRSSGFDPSGTATFRSCRYIRAKKIPVPKLQELGGARVRIWADQDIETVRALLPKIANGRKTRYQKKKKRTKPKRKKA